jgi:5-methylcytosine-specific restriction endonuclease McrA
MSAYREANREKRKQYLQQYYLANPDKVKERQCRYRRANPEIGAACERERLARKTINGGSHTSDEWLALCEQYDNRCLACGKQKPLTVDHVVPISKGGSNDIANIQPLCKSCNSAKGTKIIDYRPK